MDDEAPDSGHPFGGGAGPGGGGPGGHQGGGPGAGTEHGETGGGGGGGSGGWSWPAGRGEGTPAGAGVTEAVQAVDRRQGLGLGGDDDRLRVQLLTDPWSVWCWGFEPVRRTLKLRYPSIRCGSLLGGMFPEMPDHPPGFDVHRFFSTVEATTGMPVSTRAVDEDRPDSTYPACVHVHAVRLLDPKMEARYLRALRETVYLDGRNVSRPDVARDVAERIGVDADAFDEMLEMGDAEREFAQRMEILANHNLHAYPTLLFSFRGKTAAVQGFQSLANVLSVAEAVSDRAHPPDPAPELMAIVPEGQRVATREVAQVLGLSVEEAYDTLREAADEGRLQRERHRGGDVWVRP